MQNVIMKNLYRIQPNKGSQPTAEPADSTELEKDMSRTSMNAMWEELKNDTW